MLINDSHHDNGLLRSIFMHPPADRDDRTSIHLLKRKEEQDLHELSGLHPEQSLFGYATNTA